MRLSDDQLAKIALDNGEAQLSNTGALAVKTGRRTGRSPKDRFIVHDAITAEAVDWGSVNQPLEAGAFDRLWRKAEQYLASRPSYVSDLQVGEDPVHGIAVQVITELAWHSLFVRQLFIKPESSSTATRNPHTWTLMNAAHLKTEPLVDGVHSDCAIVLNFSERKVLVIGTQYAGEMKKAMFTVLNFLLPEKDILPMHCAANSGQDGTTALFFGLSGTGKTTLSADPDRLLIGDDEHGWSSEAVFNFEGGCYAKCINLSEKNEPVIWHAIKDGAIMENVVLNANGEPDYNDTHLTENTRAAYPREYIALRVPENRGSVPRSVIFLTCDLNGVLPPVALLTTEQAAYYFLSGYTALVGSTEVGSAAGISTTFSTCFGAPFFPRRPAEYADLLMRRIEESHAQVYLVNTGWTGGSYGAGGTRFSIPTTRRIVTAIVDNTLVSAQTDTLAGFGIRVPRHIAGVESRILNPRQAWADPAAYDRQARLLAVQFQQNFKKFKVSPQLIQAGPAF